MKHRLIIAGITALLFSCKSNTGDPGTENTSTKTASQKEIVLNPDSLLKDFMTWYTYTYTNVRLSQDFIGLDTDSAIMNKANFLTKLETGNFVPFKIDVQDQNPVYKLYQLRSPNKDIQSTIHQLAETEKRLAAMEGGELPDYEFTDLSDKRYTTANTKGKILLLKCWYINCVACVKEFPQLNKLVDKYRDRTDLLFVSLATDPKPELVAFLTKRPFNYAVVPNEGNYMSKKLRIASYPTHLLIDKKGRIVKATNSMTDMLPFLEKEVSMTH
jgi:thiol-disulfide isomerase/thioredoxin